MLQHRVFSLPCCAACSHGIVSTSVGPEYYVSILSFVDKTQLEPGCSVLLHNKVRAALGQEWSSAGSCLADAG